jgi:hypothetical protein
MGKSMSQTAGGHGTAVILLGSVASLSMPSHAGEILARLLALNLTRFNATVSSN